MKKLISNGWNIFEIGIITGGGYVVEHMANRLAEQAATVPIDPATILFTIKQAAFWMFWLGLTIIVVKAIDSPVQRALAEWAGLPPKLTVQPPDKNELTAPPEPPKVAPVSPSEQPKQP